MKQEWIDVLEYAKRMGKSKAQISLDIRLGKIPKEKQRKVKYEYIMKRTKTELLYEEKKV